MKNPPLLVARSMLFVPANRPERYVKALESGADIVCVDMEDAVPPEHKAGARKTMAKFFRHPLPPDTRRALRINSLATLDGLRDILWLKDHGINPELVLLPKTSGPETVEMLHALLIETGTDCPILALIETAEGLDNAAEIALSPHVIGLCFGSADYTAEAGANMEWDALIYGRGRLIQAAARGGVLALDGAWLDFTDTEGLVTESRRLPALGFDGRVVIHPGQIDGVHAAFAPVPADLSRAQKIMAAVAHHSGGAIAVDGRMVDRPVIAWAERMIARAARG